MNKVFEDFLVVALRDALGVSDRVLVQGASGKRLFLDTRDHIALKPDISLWKGGVCLFVGDAKYKRIRPDAYPNADLYELTAAEPEQSHPNRLDEYRQRYSQDRGTRLKRCLGFLRTA
jgi:5-methylcytosine-specific restriction endonuclease McrBC regulatory subunit McrC